MYAPAPPRPKKTQIVRSRSGCKCCRERRTKCDEKKPKCGTCARLGTACEPVKPSFQFRMVTAPAASTAQTRDKPSAKSRDESVVLNSRVSSAVQLSGKSMIGIPAIPDITIIQSLQHSERDMFYSTYWEDQCLPTLHPMFVTSSSLIGNFPALKDAVLALSSCNWSRINAERKSASAVTLMGGFTPNLSHLTRSQLYYSAAIRSFSKFTPLDLQRNPIVVLTMLVIFAYIESTMGNFRGFNCHVQGLSTFLDEETTHSAENSSMKELLTAWMQPQFLVWWARAYFSTLKYQQHQPRIEMPLVLQGSFDTFHERRVAVLSILCESHRLNFGAALKHWNHTIGDDSSEYDDNSQADAHGTEQCHLQLADEAKKLDDWLLHLPPSEQPLQNLTHDNHWDSDTLSIQPIKFACHDAALNYAYYVVSRIMQCTGILHFLRTRDPRYLGCECYDAQHWVQLFLRITSGIEFRACIRQNTYTIGFSGLILAVLLRCQDLGSGLWIESWLQKLQSIQPTEEGSFPVYQALAVTKAINRQRAMDRDVFGFSQPVDDKGGVPKFSAYNSQVISTPLIHGKVRATGNLFTESISIEG